jgi:hypothetical protein
MLGLTRPTSGTATAGRQAYQQLDDPIRVVGSGSRGASVPSGPDGRNHLSAGHGGRAPGEQGRGGASAGGARRRPPSACEGLFPWGCETAPPRPWGARVGALLRNHVAAVVLVLVILFVIDPAVSAVVEDYAEYSLSGLGISLSRGAGEDIGAASCLRSGSRPHLGRVHRGAGGRPGRRGSGPPSGSSRRRCPWRSGPAGQGPAVEPS